MTAGQLEQVFLSAIVPTWCEAARISGTVTACRSFADEVIVADAMSPDGTAERARRAGARVVLCPQGRGVQLNWAARHARGRVLVFVHADTHLPPTARSAIARALSSADVVGGNFRLRFVPETPVARLFAWGNHVRRVAIRRYYGDSCVFVRRSAFEQLGGFRNYPIFEDYDFVARLEALGRTHYETEVCASTSDRRFARQPLRTLVLWAKLQVLFSCGVEPQRLVALYRHAR